ncbi:tRNA threonylcarbamoyladenosine dehydratase [Saccharibacillus sp. CPCC 101409]|uniref:tRNA threonylcarbamoyladenosine dehydratase n=1 Tax=Saccharibacillus sp. CPCC 101409 TaxID=3058041 RepID=UPI0026741603|nr:tRNA threonylcarbamoyladenosine dehydratase [Saccharibacillus sp. CPCC 101409]MDO3409018.1 tRNA threonylcarbamoyladenosine dehydratase [Saccharibacillus sp. CPCC 101409]
MLHAFSRTELAIGPEGLDALKSSTVAVLGIGGVGAMAVEGLARSGVGTIILIDKDVVDITNINRQIHALTTTVGQQKTELMAERVKLINPEIQTIVLNMFYTEETYEKLFEHKIDYVLDASDTIVYKIHIIKECLKRGIPILSSMGAANKLDPTRFRIADISKTKMDPIARIIRNKLRKEDGIKKGVKVVFSTEPPVKPRVDVTEQIAPAGAKIRKAKQPPASNSFVPPTVGLIMVSEAVKDLLAIHGHPLQSEE